MRIYNKRYILEVDFEYPKDLYDLRSDLPLLSARMKIVISLHAICMIKKLCCSHKIIKISINSSISI